MNFVFFLPCFMYLILLVLLLLSSFRWVFYSVMMTAMAMTIALYVVIVILNCLVMHKFNFLQWIQNEDHNFKCAFSLKTERHCKYIFRGNWTDFLSFNILLAVLSLDLFLRCDVLMIWKRRLLRKKETTKWLRDA